MKEYKSLDCNRAGRIAGELNRCIDYLYYNHCPYCRDVILKQLRYKIKELQSIKSPAYTVESKIPSESFKNLHRQRTFTLEELAKYNGKNGNPAYVAVNGTVYDVTNSAVWAAATHFGLSAGKDLTNEFASCHAGQPILNKLKIVGKLV